jgi:hypothetical protein
MKYFFSLFILLVLLCNACSEKQSKGAQSEASFKVKLMTTETPLNTKGLTLLKSIADSQKKSDRNHAIKFFNKDSITGFVYLRDLFPVWESDSIEFY